MIDKYDLTSVMLWKLILVTCNNSNQRRKDGRAVKYIVKYLIRH